jgi:GNAT superfamily N-acetyltransferase
MNAQDEIRIVELTPALLNDYLSFFDHDAFVDNPQWASCYCYFNSAPHKTEDWDHRTALQNRAAVTDMIRSGRMHGFLAYAGGKPIGWCNANLHASYTTLDETEPERERIGVIVCFTIAKPYRGMGVARRLLEAVCAGFRDQGVSLVEAYPRKNTNDQAVNYHGPLSMYLAAGFKPVKETETLVVVRKELMR